MLLIIMAIFGLALWAVLTLLNRRKQAVAQSGGLSPAEYARRYQQSLDAAVAAVANGPMDPSVNFNVNLEPMPWDAVPVLARRLGPGFSVEYVPNPHNPSAIGKVVVVRKSLPPRAPTAVPSTDGRLVLDPDDLPPWLGEAQQSGHWRVHFPPHRNPDGTVTCQLQPMF